MSDISENTNYDENICIICLEDLDDDKISLNACDCKNKVHADCLLTWIEHKNSMECEICKSDYIIPMNIINNYINNINNNYLNYQTSDYNYHPNISLDNIEISISDSNNVEVPNVESDESVSDDEEREENERRRFNFQNYNICRQAVVYYVMIVLPLICLTFMITILVITIKNHN